MRAAIPEICRFYGIVIQMYARDHHPAHFHARYGSQAAVFDINGVQLLHGELPLRAQRLVEEWATLHRRELLDNWQRLRQGRMSERIAPLD